MVGVEELGRVGPKRPSSFICSRRPRSETGPLPTLTLPTFDHTRSTSRRSTRPPRTHSSLLGRLPMSDRRPPTGQGSQAPNGDGSHHHRRPLKTALDPIADSSPSHLAVLRGIGQNWSSGGERILNDSQYNPAIVHGLPDRHPTTTELTSDLWPLPPHLLPSPAVSRPSDSICSPLVCPCMQWHRRS